MANRCPQRERRHAELMAGRLERRPARIGRVPVLIGPERAGRLERPRHLVGRDFERRLLDDLDLLRLHQEVQLMLLRGDVELEDLFQALG